MASTVSQTVARVSPQRSLQLALAAAKSAEENRGQNVTILDQGVSDRPGTAQLSISERTPTVTSLASDWRDARATDAGFAQVRWNRRPSFRRIVREQADRGKGQFMRGAAAQTYWLCRDAVVLYRIV